MLDELQLQSKIIETFKNAGGYGWKMGSSFGNVGGIPDLCIIKGTTILIEVKVVETINQTPKVEPIQTLTLNKSAASGGNVLLLVILRKKGDYTAYGSKESFKKRPIEGGDYINLGNIRTPQFVENVINLFKKEM